MPSPSLTLLRTQSDDRLVALACDGHERAFEAIVDRYRRPLLRAARRVLPEGRAEDALQQALMSAWTALQRGDEVRDLRPWLYRIVHNTSLNALRMSGYDYAELHEAARIADAGDEELERRAVVRQTLASLAALPERQREALLRTAVSGDSPEAVARDLGLSGNALRQLVHRARVSVRAAATALTPMPLVTAAAAGSSRGDPLVERISELATGGGASLTLAKAGAVAVLAGGAISGPAIVDRAADRPAKDRIAAAAVAPAPERARASAAAAAPEPVRALPLRPAAARDDARGHGEKVRRHRRSSGPDNDESRSGSRHRGSGDDESDPPRSSGPGHHGSDDEDPGDDESGDGSGSSGPGSGHEAAEDDGVDDEEPSASELSGSGSSGPDDDGSGSDDAESGSSGPGSAPAPVPLASVTPTPEPDEHSGEDHE